MPALLPRRNRSVTAVGAAASTDVDRADNLQSMFLCETRIEGDRVVVVAALTVRLGTLTVGM